MGAPFLFYHGGDGGNTAAKPRPTGHDARNGSDGSGGSNTAAEPRPTGHDARNRDDGSNTRGGGGGKQEGRMDGGVTLMGAGD